MSQHIAFLLSKDPTTTHGGDMTMFRTLETIAREAFATEVICLSEIAGGRTEAGLTRVAKPAVSRASLAARSLVRGRSLVHTRFDVAGLTEAVERAEAGRFVALHSYMAESYLRAAGAEPARDLLVSTEVAESAVWRSTRGGFARVEAARIARDERRVAHAARSIATYDQGEAEAHRREGLARVHYLPITLPPAAPVDVAATPPRLAFLGDRRWLPNADAAAELVRLWPAMSAGIDRAELVLIGSPPGDNRSPLPSGVTDCGFVPVVDDLLGTCRAIVAPIATGGGVRVKILEAAARGLPVVSTTAGLGSLAQTFGIEATDGDDAFVRACRAMLLDAGAAAAKGRDLHAANAERWNGGTVHTAVHEWMTA